MRFALLLLAALAFAQPADELRRARDLVAAGKPEQAIAIYERLVAASPGEAGPRVNLAIALFKARRYREAAAQAEAALKLQPDLFSASLFLGASRIELGQAEDAIEPLRKAVEGQPRDRNARLLFADALLATGRHREAAGQYRQTAELAPDNDRAWRGLVLALYRSRDYESALPILEKLLQRQPDSAELNFLYGGSLVNLEQPERALSYLEKAVARDPQFLPARAALGQALLRIGRFKEAIAHLEAAAPTDEDGSLHHQLGRACQAAGQPECAKRALEKSEALRRQRAERAVTAP